MRAVIFLGLIGAGAAGLLAPSFVDAPTWFIAVAYVAIAGVVLFFIAGVRLQRQVMPDAEKRIPHNRDALVTAITALQRTANAVTLDYHIVDFMSRERPNDRITVDRAREAAYRTAEEELEVQERIAGADFYRRLRLYRMGMSAEANKWRYSDGPISEDEYTTIRKTINERTDEILRLLDNGRLYFP